MSGEKPNVDRRRFLAAAAGGAAAATAPAVATVTPAQAQGVGSFVKPPSARDMEAEIGQPIKIAATMAEPGSRPGLRLHGGCAARPRHRLRRHQPGLELPRPARVDHQLRRRTRSPNSSP